MDKKTQITIRSKKLGVLIRDARMAARRNIRECADAIGTKSGTFRAYEEGRKSPSLPELETLVYYLDLPIDHFWSREIKSISGARIQAYELGERPIPLPELEVLVSTLGGQIETFFDRSGPIGQWLTNEEAIQQFLDLPDDLRQFVALPVNRPYLELAMKLSAMSKDKLRSVAEDLLDITL